MGYSGLKTWGSGDVSAGLVYTYVEHLTKTLKSGLRDKGNQFNPSGAVNVALFNESFILPIAKQLSLADPNDLGAVLFRASEKLQEEIEDGQNTSADEWGGTANKRMHIDAYRRMLKNLKTTLKVFEVYPDAWMAARTKRRKKTAKK